jgi:hypothetical protein
MLRAKLFIRNASMRLNIHSTHKDVVSPFYLTSVEGLEPPTRDFGDRCSPKLSYTPKLIQFIRPSMCS